MQKDIHPDYNYVLFRDLASGESFLTKSTMTSQKTEKWEDGNEYPSLKLKSHQLHTPSTPVSSASWTPPAALSASMLASLTSARRHKFSSAVQAEHHTPQRDFLSLAGCFCI